MLKYLVIFTIFISILCKNYASEELPAKSLYLGQDEGIEHVGLRIRLGENSDLLYPLLLWNYRTGVRHFSIVSDNPLNSTQLEKISFFHKRVEDICTLILSGENAQDFDALQWILETTDRQFLCLYKPLSEIISENSNSSLSFPSCEYRGFDPGAPLSVWPQTDEHLTYHTPIDDSFCVPFRNSAFPEALTKSSSAYIATFTTRSMAIPFTSEMVPYPLPIMKVISDSVRHACLRGQEYWSDGQFVDPITENLQEQELVEFQAEHGSNTTIRFGEKYIYVPVPKAGWSTITRALGSYELGRQIPDAAYKDFNKFPNEIAKRIQYLCDPASYVFTCIREPFRRILSAYLEKIYDTAETYFKRHLGFSAEENVSFIDFLKALKRKPFKEMDRHFKPQWLLLMSPYIKYKFIHLENFNTEFREVMEYLDIPGTPDDYKWDSHSKSASSKLSEFYTQECIDLVLEIFDKDFNLGNGYNKTPDFILKS